jgi:PDZ domain
MERVLNRNGRGIGNSLAVAPVILLLLCGGMARAQSSDEAWYRRAMNSAGKAMYFCAWPTDTYDHMEFGGIQWQPGGADVSVILYGTSWLEGDLWVEVVAEFRNGQMTKMAFGRYSKKAIIPPGTVGKKVLEAINRELQRQESPVAVLCLSNPTPDAISYSLPAEEASQTLSPGQTIMFWHTGADDFTVSFGATRTGGLQRTFRLKGVTQASKPASCQTPMTYDFVVSGERVALQPRTWTAGTESPTGIIGVELRIEEGDSFPTIVTVRTGTPAGRAYVPAGALLVEVNGESVRSLSIDDVVARTRGPVNTVVKVGVLPRGSDRIQYFNLKRE